jgi:MinD superfamily P-loop ATPase
LILQDHRCGICGVHESEYPKKFSVDHDHTDYSVRGLLCHGCNTAIGMLDEDIEFLKRAIGYLMHHKTTIIQGETWTETES